MRIAGALMALMLGRERPGRGGSECGPDRLGTSARRAVGTEGGLEVGLKTYPADDPASPITR